MNAQQQGKYPNDRSLVDACLQGREDAWVAFQHLYTPVMYAIIRQPGWRFSEQDAEDICSDVFMKLIDGGLRQYAFQCPLRNFVSLIAKNACIDRIRAQWARKAVSLDRLLAGGATFGEMLESRIRVADIVMLNETLLEIKTAFERLSEDCRRILRLFYREEMAYDLIARTLGISTGTVGARISRCRKRLIDYVGFSFEPA